MLARIGTAPSQSSFSHLYIEPYLRHLGVVIAELTLPRVVSLAGLRFSHCLSAFLVSVTILFGNRYSETNITILHIRPACRLSFRFWSFRSTDVSTWLSLHPPKVTLGIVCLSIVSRKSFFLMNFDVKYILCAFYQHFLRQPNLRFLNIVHGRDLLFSALETSWLWSVLCPGL